MTAVWPDPVGDESSVLEREILAEREAELRAALAAERDDDESRDDDAYEPDSDAALGLTDRNVRL